MYKRLRTHPAFKCDAVLAKAKRKPTANRSEYRTGRRTLILLVLSIGIVRVSEYKRPRPSSTHYLAIEWVYDPKIYKREQQTNKQNYNVYNTWRSLGLSAR